MAWNIQSIFILCDFVFTLSNELNWCRYSRGLLDGLHHTCEINDIGWLAMIYDFYPTRCVLPRLGDRKENSLDKIIYHRKS